MKRLYAKFNTRIELNFAVNRPFTLIQPAQLNQLKTVL